MYTPREMTKLREAFWTAFGKYMAPVPSADGEKINWINYKTGVKDIRLVLEVNDRSVSAGILISHSDNIERLRYYNKLLELKTLFKSVAGEEWLWEPGESDMAGRTVSRIYTVLPGKSITRQEDWPAIISFFKSRIIMLDEFWQMVRDGFQS